MCFWIPDFDNVASTSVAMSASGWGGARRNSRLKAQWNGGFRRLRRKSDTQRIHNWTAPKGRGDNGVGVSKWRAVAFAPVCSAFLICCDIWMSQISSHHMSRVSQGA